MECNAYSVLHSGLHLEHYKASRPSSASPGTLTAQSEAHTFPAPHTGSTTNLTLKALNTEEGI